jgi:hypothetical protein
MISSLLPTTDVYSLPVHYKALQNYKNMMQPCFLVKKSYATGHMLLTEVCSRSDSGTIKNRCHLRIRIRLLND